MLRVRFGLKQRTIHRIRKSRAAVIHQEQIVTVHQRPKQSDIAMPGFGCRISRTTFHCDNRLERRTIALCRIDDDCRHVEFRWIIAADGQSPSLSRCLHRIIARIDERNEPSVRMVRRLGMRLEARLVENEWFKGVWTTELDFAMLAAEWQARSRSQGP